MVNSIGCIKFVPDLSLPPFCHSFSTLFLDKKRLPPGRVSYFLINPFGDTYEYRYSLPGEHLLTIIIGQKQRPRLLTEQAIRGKTAILLELSYGEIDILAKLIIDG